MSARCRAAAGPCRGGSVLQRGAHGRDCGGWRHRRRRCDRRRRQGGLEGCVALEALEAHDRRAQARRRDRQPLLSGRRSPARPLNSGAAIASAATESRNNRDMRGNSTSRRKPTSARDRGQASLPLPDARRAGGWTASCARAKGSSRGSSTSAARRSSSTAGSAATAPWRSAQSPRNPTPSCRPHALEEAVTRMRFSLAVDDDLTPFYKEFKRDPFIGPAIRRRPVASRQAPPVRVGGACLGDHRAAHRVLARGADPEADHPARGGGPARGRGRAPSTGRSRICPATRLSPAWRRPNSRAATWLQRARSQW